VVTLPPIATGEVKEMSDHQLIFRTSKDKDEVEVVMDKQGAELLLEALTLWCR
jgi:hypothetical protein